MKFYHILDGEPVRKEILDAFQGREWFSYDDIRGRKDEEKSNFVGFIFKGDTALISFPKHYMDKDELEALELNFKESEPHYKLLYKVMNKILKDTSSKDERFQGLKEEFNSYFPFSAYYQIYDYYKNFGLFTNVQTRKKFGYSGKISWKDTIQKSPMVVNKGNVLYMPMVIKKQVEEHVFISKCMSYVINSTLQKFSIFLEGVPPELDYNDIVFDEKSNDFIISHLIAAKRTFFKDVHVSLIDALIEFFKKEKNNGGHWQLKIYSFDVIWESLVANYLRQSFLGFDHQTKRFKFCEVGGVNKNFKKEVAVKPDIRNRYNDEKVVDGEKVFSLRLDYYFEENGYRYILDAKYYTEITGLNYKQISYYFLTKNARLNNELLESVGSNITNHYINQPIPECNPNEISMYTVNALLLPCENDERKTETHFQLNTDYNKDETHFEVLSVYLNVHKLMTLYVKF